ncbi:MAG TPA: lipopolysaccharide kinase InaA family protein [Tepidisphaeraceae bacterium]|nr:lipopolysaccharide kinase InaA family protein [Tepidisphaeraceae bacterium]
MSSADELQRALADLPKVGRLVKSRPYRQVWRFEFGGRAYFLKFYPRDGAALKRLVRGSPALREFTNLQAMQRAKVPSPRAVAHLSGFSIEGRKGDAVLIEAIEPAEQLDHFLNNRLLRGEAVPEHRDLARQVVDIVRQLGQAKLGHVDLHLGNFLLSNGKLHLLDGYAVRPGGMRTRDILLLGHSVARFATKADILRAWRAFSDAPLPRKNPVRRRQWRKLLESAAGDNAYFARLRIAADAGAAWSGHAFKHHKFPRRWAPASRLDVTKQDWERELPHLLARVINDQLEILKRSASGDVLAGEVVLGGRPVSVVVKRTRRRKMIRYVSEIGRGGRALRAWRKAWSLVARDIPTAWPLAVLERRTLGYPIDSLIVLERVPGRQLADLDLSALSPAARQDLFRRLGRTLRRLEEQGLRQYDSKFTNWIVNDDPKRGPVPVVIDVDGIRRITPPMWPIDRLLRSLRDHPQYAPEDSRQLCLGYAPFARLAQEPAGTDQVDDDEDEAGAAGEHGAPRGDPA